MTAKETAAMTEKKVKFRLKGHESFILREGWLTKGLFAVRKNPGVFTDNSGADELGVGTNMAKAIRYWMRCAGLILEEARGQVRLSRLGECLLKEDPYFEDLFSLWMIHIHIARNFEQASVWYAFFNLYEQESFTRRMLETQINDIMQDRTQNAALSQRSLQDDCEALLQMYTRRHIHGNDPEEKKVSPFCRLELIREQEGNYRRENPDLKKLSALAVLYVMQEIMEQASGNFWISVDSLLDREKSPGRILQLGRSFLMQYLEELAQREYIALNRTAGLDMVYQTKIYTQEEILQDYFGGKRKPYAAVKGIDYNQ